MGLVKPLALIAGFAALAAAQSFTLTIGNVSAAKVARKAYGGMAVRAEGCASGAKITGVIVRTAGGTRTSTPLSIYPSDTKGVWGASSAEVLREPWLAVVTGECGGAKAGVIVPFDARGLYNREKARFLSHAPTSNEINEALKELD